MIKSQQLYTSGVSNSLQSQKSQSEIEIVESFNLVNDRGVVQLGDAHVFIRRGKTYHCCENFEITLSERSEYDVVALTDNP